MLGAVAAGPRSAEDGDRGAGSTGRLGVGWGTGEAGASRPPRAAAVRVAMPGEVPPRWPVPMAVPGQVPR